MARSIRSQRRIDRAENAPYAIAVGDGLELRVNPDGSRYWTHRRREPGAPGPHRWHAP
jgi:hypothetical protein